MADVTKDFEELFACFARHAVRAVIVGAHAVAFHVWSSRVVANYGQALVSFIGRNELIRNKRASGRPQDLADLSWLEAKE